MNGGLDFSIKRATLCHSSESKGNDHVIHQQVQLGEDFICGAHYLKG